MSLTSTDIRTLIVSGFIRTKCNLLIPRELVELCILYYILKEKLKINCDTSYHKQNKISGANEDIFINHYDKSVWNLTGNITLKSGKHHWRFQILKTENTCYGDHDIQIGIQKIQDNEIKNAHFFDFNISYHATFIFNTKSSFYHKDKAYKCVVTIDWELYKEYGKKVETGDIIDMYLDLDGTNKDNKGILSFAVNDIQKGIARDDIDCNVEYKMGMHLSADIQLLLYERVGMLPKECYEEIYPKSNQGHMMPDI